MLGKRVFVRAVLLASVVLVSIPGQAFATGDVGENVENLLKGYATDFYSAGVAIFSLVFLWNRRYVELATFLFAAIVIAWMVFVPQDIGDAAEGIGKQIFS